MDLEALGGWRLHAETTGLIDRVVDTDAEAMDAIKRFLSYMPSHNGELPPVAEVPPGSGEGQDRILGLLPEKRTQVYDIRKILEVIVDHGSMFELKPRFGKSAVVALARLGGKVVGLIANNPAASGGALTVDAIRKILDFTVMCDSFNIPLLVLEDVPGFLPGTDQEWNGIISNGAKLLYAFSEATVPRVTVITRKAYGGAYDVMNSKHIGADMNYAWPTAEIAVMGAKGAAEIIFKKEIAEAADKDAKWKEKEAEYAHLFANPYSAAERGYIDEVIIPSQTREKLIRAFAMLQNKAEKAPRKKHSNMPL
jgi:propionyl-CoA carboxylase beta chain